MCSHELRRGSYEMENQLWGQVVMNRSVYNSPSADVCCIKLKLQNGTFLEEFNPQIKEGLAE